MQIYPDPIHEPFVMGNGRVGALLIHGFPGTPFEVRDIGRVLAEYDVTAHGILLPGFGRDIVRIHETDRHEWVEGARTAWKEVQEQYDHAILIGYSMGGAVAVHLAYESPPEKLVLLAPFWRVNFWPVHYFMPIIERLRPKVSPFEQADPQDPEFRRTIGNILPDLNLDDPAEVERMKKEVVLPTRLLGELVRLGRNAYKIAPKLTVPTLVIQGDQDDIVRPEYTDTLIERLQKQAEVTVKKLPTADHHFPKTPGPYSKIVTDYLGEILNAPRDQQQVVDWKDA